MQPTFNLIEQPWIPVIRQNGSTGEMSLRETLAQAENIREIGGESPMVTGSLYRLLLALLHSIHRGPADEDQWRQLWRDGWDQQAINEYLDTWREHFDLFHPARPFYQCADERMTPRSITAMIHDAASGNNATLFDHHVDDDVVSLTPAQAARLLLAVQNYGLAGPCNPKLKLYFTGGPCVGGILFLAQGDTLRQTLTLNLLPYPYEGTFPHSSQDRPVWEVEDPLTPEREVPLGYLDYLTWQNRRVLLLPTAHSGRVEVREITMSPALSLSATVLDPMMHYRVSEQSGHRPLGFSESRALWRDSVSLFQLRSEDQHPPRVLQWLADLDDAGMLERRHTYRLQALGMVNDKAKMEFFRQERFPLPPAYLETPSVVEALQTALTMAEEAANQLWGATATLAKEFISPGEEREPRKEDWKPLLDSWGVGRFYWAQLETPFRLTMETLSADTTSALTAWQQTVRLSAWSAFRSVTDNLDTTPRSLRAVVHAQGQLAAGLAKVLPPT